MDLKTIPFENCTLVTTAHDESIALKAIVESKCKRCIILYQHSVEKIPDTSYKNAEYIQINGYHGHALKEIDNTLKDIKDVKFYLANVHMDRYILYYLLGKKRKEDIWIFDNNQFVKMP